MWVMIGHDYLNLDNIDCVRFTRDQDGTFSASAISRWVRREI